MRTDEISRRVRCCGCGGQIGRVNLIELDYRASWQYPRCGNVLTGDDGRATAICCDACAVAGRVREAVEFRGDDVVYHPLESLVRLPPPPSYLLVNGPAGRPGIKCLYCGQISFDAQAVAERHCPRCGQVHARRESQASGLKPQVSQEP